MPFRNNMGFWKNVAYDMQRGMSKQTAIKVNSSKFDKNLTALDRKKIEAEGEAEIALNSIP
jgi:hypothetical protein